MKHFIWSFGEDISAKDNNVRMIGVNSEWVILVNHIQFAVGEKPCTTKKRIIKKDSLTSLATDRLSTYITTRKSLG